MTAKGVSLEQACEDCLATGNPRPGSRTRKSPRCYEHQRLRDLHMAAGRNRRARAKKQGTAGPSRAEWARAYQPRAIHIGPNGRLLTPTDVDHLRNVLDDLNTARAAGNNAYRRGDPAALANGLRDLLDHLDETWDALHVIVR